MDGFESVHDFVMWISAESFDEEKIVWLKRWYSEWEEING